MIIKPLEKEMQLEQWHSLFKARMKRFRKRFPYHSSLESVKTWTIGVVRHL